MRHVVACLLLALIVSGCGSLSSSTVATAPTALPAASYYIARLSALNNSGVSGTVEMALSDNIMEVTISLAGLVPNQQHMQHIHGGHDTLATCPTPVSANADGVITLAAGMPAYGPVALPFEPTPTADAAGKITWSRRMTLTPDDIFAIASLTQHVVLIHGLGYKGVYEQTLPAACGPIQAA